ncbi:hypothetical protein GW915_08025 [bacterium]|nr:hypothetical protein [bacterium]
MRSFIFTPIFWTAIGCLLCALVGAYPYYQETMKQNSGKTHRSPSSAVIALTGGTIDIQEGGLYDELRQTVKTIEKRSKTKTIGLVRHISEWKSVCSEMEERLSAKQIRSVSIITTNLKNQVEINNLLGCLKKGDTQTSVTPFNHPLKIR